MHSSGYPIHKLFKQLASPLGKLIEKALEIEKLNTLFTQVLDKELVPHCKVGCYVNGVLTLFSDSAAWATRLRYQTPSLLSKLRTFPHWVGLRSIQIKVQAYIPSEPICTSSDNTSRPQLSVTGAEFLESLANSLKDKPENHALISSLERLAKHKK